MGYLEDLNTIIRSAATFKGTLDENKHKSITRGALDGTLQFPCIISDAIPIDMASVIARTLERVYASFVQTYLSTNNTIDISVDKNPNMFLKRFHKNIKVESTIEDLYQEYCMEKDEEYDKLMERIYNGTTKAYINEKKNRMILFNFSDKFNNAVYEAHKEALEDALSSIDYTPFPNIGNSPFYEAPKKSDFGDYPDQKRLDDFIYRQKDKRQFAHDNYKQKRQFDHDDFKADREYSRKKYFTTADYIKDVGMAAWKSNMDKKASELDYQRDLQRDADKRAHDINLQNIKDKNALDREKWKYKNGGNLTSPSLLKDTDVKKSNDLQPYLMQVRLMAVNSKDEFVNFIDFIVGVKVILHNIKSDEMIINLQAAIQNNGKLFNFIRWTTGEKSLFKDLLLRINDTKLDISNKSKGSSPWWSTLKRLKETSKAQKTFFKRTQLVPQSTIVISAFDADSIEKTYGYNLRDPKIAIKLMKSLFLMNFAIVDEGTRTLEILYDGETAYQTYALETLEREVTMSSNRIGKELTRMISR